MMNIMSNMKAMLCFVLFTLGSVVSDIAGECEMAGFYLELGCTPVAIDDNSKCPAAFTCPDLHPDRSMCYYRGVAYSDETYIPQNLILSSCTRGCICNILPNADSMFSCLVIDCFDSFNRNRTMQKPCIYTHKLDSCCGSGVVCGKDAIAKLKTCDVDGKTYYEGQTFEPKNTHKTCICTADWDGKVDNTSYCRDINCGLEIHYQSYISNKCAPVYLYNRGCPIGFECPSPTTTVKRGVNTLDNNNAQCIFGNETLRVGDELLVGKKCVTCSCVVPPFVSCHRKKICDY